jgi:heat-inducible transcriptional repressor
VHDYLALLVVVLQEARVLQQTLALEQPLSQDELTGIARRLNGLFDGKTAAQIRSQSLPAVPVEAAIMEAAATLLDTADAQGVEPSFMEGLRELLRQPEFGQGERILGVLELLEDRNISRAIPSPAIRGGGVTIVIGGEHPLDAMRLCSVITTNYAGPAGLRGSLSVVGPTRMHYPRTVSMVRYMSTLMEELLGVYFA